MDTEVTCCHLVCIIEWCAAFSGGVYRRSVAQEVSDGRSMSTLKAIQQDVKARHQTMLEKDNVLKQMADLAKHSSDVPLLAFDKRSIFHIH